MPVKNAQEDILAPGGKRPQHYPARNIASWQSANNSKKAEIILISIGLGLCFLIFFQHKIFLSDIALQLYYWLEICRLGFAYIQPSTPWPVVLAPTILVIVFFIGLVAAGKKVPRGARALLIGALFYLHTVYIFFRLFNTLNLESFSDSVVSLGLFFFEFMSYICLSTVYLQIAWPANRAGEVARFSQAVKLGEYTPSVDIFITTYNEPVDMLRRTIIGCQALEYPNKRVYLLDDGKRQQFRQLAEELDCQYISREHNLHAKAGNLNNALAQTNGELVAVFDADCIPTKMFLVKTAGFFRRPGVGMVIANQHFYNAHKDSQNMSIETVFSADQAAFFSEIQAGRDTFNAMMCFGTGFVVKRDALEHIGGIPSETLAEDWATTIKLQATGYKTYFVNELLTAGAAAESIGEFVQQRLRWAKGTLQSLYSSTNPLKIKGLRFLQRFIHVYGIIYYIMFPLQFVVLLFPLFYFFLEIIPIKITLNQMFFFFVPFFLLQQIVFSWLSNNYAAFLSSHVYEYFLYFPISSAILRLLRNPQSKLFRVTNKGISRRNINIEKNYIWPVIVMLALYLSAFFYCLYDAPWRFSEDIICIMLIWCIFRIVILWTSLQVAIDVPQERNTVRFRHNLVCWVSGNQEVLGARTVNISDEGIRVELNAIPQSFTSGGAVSLDIPEIGIFAMPARISRYAGGKDIALCYEGISIPQKRQLVEFLYCEDGRWTKVNMSSLRAALIMVKSIFRIYPIENSRRASA